VESQKAIVQAETVSKLTGLAFFFIPLTLAASLFGMNIVVSSQTIAKIFKKFLTEPYVVPQEWDGHLKVWLWATVSIGLAVPTYLVLFWQEIWFMMQKTPAYMRGVNRHRAVNGVGQLYWSVAANGSQRFSLISYGYRAFNSFKRYTLISVDYTRLIIVAIPYFLLFILCLAPAVGVGVSFWAFFTKVHISAAGKIGSFIFLFATGVYVSVLPFYLIVRHLR
jgi:hypothetical protein